MPSHESSFVVKRPPISSRHSSGVLTQHSRSSSDHLSTSATKPKTTRHLVGHARMGPRVPSYGKNVNKLAKLGAPPPPQESPTSPRLGHTKRNSSNQLLAQTATHTNLKKNHSETSLNKKRNRSSKDLSKLTRPQSSKNLTRADKRGNNNKKRNSSQNLAVEQPTVRFDLGEDEEHDDAWVEYSNSQSPATTRSNTRPNSRMSERSQSPDKHPDTQLPQKPPTPRTPPRIPSTLGKAPRTPNTPESDDSNEAQASQSSEQSSNARTAEADAITSRLLNRNTSFNATSKISNIAARGYDSTTVQPIYHSQGSGDGDLVSRFIQAGSSAGTPRDSGFLAPSNHSNDENAAIDGSKRNKSSRSMVDTANVSGTSTPVSLPPSRTQQKLWLERASTIIDQQQQQKRPPSLMNTGRFPSAGIPFQAVGTDGTIHPHVKQMFEQTKTEYRRVRIYQHPLADAITRLQNSGVAPRSKLVGRSKASATANLGDSDKYGLSQSLKSSKSAKTISTQDGKKPRVMFQGVKGSRDDGEVSSRKSMDDNDFTQESSPSDDALEICRRMWNQGSMLGNEDD